MNYIVTEFFFFFYFFISRKGSYTKTWIANKTNLVIKSRPYINRGGPDSQVM